jgi:hypothetical protein
MVEYGDKIDMQVPGLGRTRGLLIPATPSPKPNPLQGGCKARRRYAPLKPIAVLVDGVFFLKAYPRTIGPGKLDDPKTVAGKLHEWALAHAKDSYH